MNQKQILTIALAMILSSIILGSYFYQARKPVNIIRVVGYASGEYDSDILKWVITLAAQTTGNNPIQAIQSLNRDINSFRDFLNSRGFDGFTIEIAPSWNWPTYNRDGIISGYMYEQKISFTCREIFHFEEIEEYAISLEELFELGINLRSSNIEYYISELPELKIAIIGEATNDARERAQEVARTTKTKLGKLINGRVGVFQITEPLSVEVQSMGIFSTHTRKKQISVTMTGEFELR